MKKLVLTTAALLAGTALAAAQGMNPPAGNKTEGAAPAPATQQKAPAEKVSPQAQKAPSQTTGQAPKADADAKAGANGEAPKAKADMKAGAKDAFVDPQGCATFVRQKDQEFRAELAKQMAGKAKH